METCPGCGLEMPATDLAYAGYYHCSPSCWSVFTELQGRQIHAPAQAGNFQLTVDTYAAQHAGGGHPDKSVMLHLIGLHLALESDLRSDEVTRAIKGIADHAPAFPHLQPPSGDAGVTVFAVAAADLLAPAITNWAEAVWKAWTAHHAAVRSFADRWATVTRCGS